MSGKLMYFFIYSFINLMRKIGWWRWRIEGVDHLPPRADSGIVLVMNHIHWVDIPVVGALLPFPYRLSWLGKAELFDRPVGNWFFRTMNVIPIKRGRGDLAALETATEALQQGAVLLIFPEGHRSGNGVLQKGHGGAIRLAVRAQVPLVPVAVTGTHHGFGGVLRGKEIVLRIGTPYRIEQPPLGKIPPDLMEQLTTQMMRRIAGLLPAELQGPYADTQQLPADPSPATPIAPARGDHA